jgi:hypothetical protein
MISLRVSRLLSSVALLLLCHASAFAQEVQATERDRAAIARMSFGDLALSILSVRTDLKEYSRDDLATTSGQYELFYEETMGSCKRSSDQVEPYALCEGASRNVSFVSQVESNRRICPAAITESCWKPALTKDQMREELLDLLNRYRQRQWSAHGDQLTTKTSLPEAEQSARSH